MEIYFDNTLSGQGTQASPLGIVGDYIYYGEVSGLVTSGGNKVVSANVPNGYKFLCWLGSDVATRGETNTIGFRYNHNEPTSGQFYWVAKYNANDSHAWMAYLCIKEN